jgi:hypothetical protein
MNRWWNMALAGLIALLIFSPASADKEVKFGGEVFSHWYMDLSDTLDAFGNRSDVDFDSYNEFGISRTYLTGKAKLSEKTFGRITVDVNPSDDMIHLKYGYIGWKCVQSEPYSFGGKLGLVENPYINNMDWIWGRRYISMTPSEITEMQPAADFGISMWGKLGEKGKWGRGYLSLFNGTSYMSPDENNPSKDIDFTLFLTPLSAQPDFEKSTIGFQFVTGKVNAYDDSAQTSDDYKKTLISFLADLRYSGVFNLGLEYNSYKSPYVLDVLGVGLNNFAADQSDIKVNSISIFGTLWFGEFMPDSKVLSTLDLFFRYVMLDPDGDDHDNIGYGAPYEVKASQMMIGLECSPIKGLKSSLNYQQDKITDFGAGIEDVTNSYLYLNMGLWF